MNPTLALQFKCSTYEAAQQIGVLCVQGIQEELSGPRSGRYYPTPGNVFYHKETYKSLPPEQKAKVNYHLKFVGARSREEIMGSAYQASAPGEPPASRTGRLRQSFYMTIEHLDDYLYQVSVRTTVFYADDLEYGNERIDPRPFIGPAVKKKLPQIFAIQQQFLYQVIRG